MDIGVQLHRRLRELNYGKRHSYFLTKAIMRSAVEVDGNKITPLILTHKGKSHILPAILNSNRENEKQPSWK